jgi:hypothetical protein
MPDVLPSVTVFSLPGHRLQRHLNIPDIVFVIPARLAWKGTAGDGIYFRSGQVSFNTGT